jgi:hypothetical protein
MTIENYLALAVGLIAVVCGLLMVRHRVKVFRCLSDAQRALGGPLGRTIAKGWSPFWMGVVGGGFTFIGIVVIGVGIFGREG